MGTCFFVDGVIMFSNLTITAVTEMIMSCHYIDRVSILYNGEMYTGYEFIRALRAV